MAIDQRHSTSRRTFERRSNDRRVIPHAFGSPMWIENISKNYLAWPESDRRGGIRRAIERRDNDRRTIRLGNFHVRSPSDLLSEEERKLLHEMFKG